MPADVLATLGARASTDLVLTPQSWVIPSPASEESKLWPHLPGVHGLLTFIVASLLFLRTSHIKHIGSKQTVGNYGDN